MTRERAEELLATNPHKKIWYKFGNCEPQKCSAFEIDLRFVECFFETENEKQEEQNA
jgi:hypothetical protein